jgi:hypothetical protein
LITENGYDGVIETAWENPLGGRWGFANESFGYQTTRANLATLKGSNLRIRFRIGTDSSFNDYGWFIDDVRIYSCGVPPGAFSKSSPVSGTVQPANVTLSWAASLQATRYEYCLDTSNNTVCDTAWVSTTQTSVSQPPLTLGTTYYWQVRSWNGITGPLYADGGVWSSFSIMDLAEKAYIPLLVR